MKYWIFILTILLIYNTFLFAENEQAKFLRYKDSAIQETNGEISLTYSLKMLNIAKQLSNDSLIIMSYIELTHDYNKLGNYPEALNYALKLAKIYEKNLEYFKKKGALGMAYNLIANTYYNLRNYSKAIEYQKKACLAHKEIRFKPLLGDDYIGLGEIFRINHMIDSAFYYFSLADSIYKNFNTDSSRLALSNCNLGLAHLALNNTKQADSLLQLSFDYYIPNKNFHTVGIAYYEIAKNAFEKANFAKANKYSEQAIELALKNNFTEQARDIYLLLHELAAKNKQYKKANEYLSKHYQYKDSLINTKVVSKMAEQRAEFEIGQKQNEVDHFKALSKARTIIVYSLSIGLLLIVVLALFLVRVNRRRKEVNYELGDKNIKLNQALQDKEMLMREIHHRVKNNLQIISSIISLQNGRVNDFKMREVFTEMQRRIMAISSIHQKLYKGNSVSQINMKDYLEEIVASIHIAFNNDSLNVNYEILVQNVELDVDSAVSIGLIVNELTTNSYKYAFIPDEINHFIVSLNENEKGCELIVQDNGQGVPEGFDILNSDSLGLKMVNLLSRQRKGTVNYSADQGSKFLIFFEGMKVEL